MLPRKVRSALNLRNAFSHPTKRDNSKFQRKYYHVKCGDAEFIDLHCSNIAGAHAAVDDLNCFSWSYQSRFITDIQRLLIDLYEKNPEKDILKVHQVYLNRLLELQPHGFPALDFEVVHQLIHFARQSLENSPLLDESLRFADYYCNVKGNLGAARSDGMKGELEYQRQVILERLTEGDIKAWENGEPSAEHIVLALYAYSPEPQRLQQWLDRETTRTNLTLVLG